MLLPRNRAYIDWNVPVDANGNDLGVCTNNDVYRDYLTWLSDYLFTKTIEVPKNQLTLLEQYKESGADHAVLDLSDCLGYSIFDTETIQEESFNGLPFESRNQLELEAWNELTDEEKHEWTEEDYFTSVEDYNRLGAEFTEAQHIPSHIQHADIPYRAVLAALFKDIPDSNKRYELLDYFYRNFNECASK